MSTTDHKRQLAAERSRRRRRRARAGLALLEVEVNFIAVTEALIETGRLDSLLADDREAAAAAVEDLLRDWTSAVTRDGGDSFDDL
jgi:hypothetical protein